MHLKKERVKSVQFPDIAQGRSQLQLKTQQIETAKVLVDSYGNILRMN